MPLRARDVPSHRWAELSFTAGNSSLKICLTARCPRAAEAVSRWISTPTTRLASLNQLRCSGVQRTVQGLFDRLLEVSQKRGRVDAKDGDRLRYQLQMMIDELTPEEGDFVLHGAMLQQQQKPQQ